METGSNIRQAVPFFAVSDMPGSLRFYVDGLGCEMTKHWTVDGEVRWCWLEIGDAAIMLQQFLTAGHGAWAPQGKPGEGVTISFQCRDALAIYREARERGGESHPAVCRQRDVGHIGG
jgi:catechol 2,3-dioxygenase-like lactoylglutathione lyase family enzyme